jgi:hypothetical protein
MSFTSHTFTSLPLVHTPNPDFFETTSLTLLITGSWISSFRKSSCAVTSEFDLQQIPEFCRLPISWFHRFMTSGLYEFATSKLRRFKIPGLRTFANSELRRFEIPDLRMSATSELRRFEIPDLRTSDVPESSFHEFHKPRCFEGDRFSWISQHAIEGEM